MTIVVEAVKQGNPPRSLYIGDARNGEIWKSLEWKKIMAGYVKKGFVYFNNSTILKIYDSALPTKQAPVSRTIAISSVCFSREMAVVAPVLEGLDVKKDPVSYCFVMAIADQRGNIYVLDFVKNKFWLVARTGVAGTCLQFNSVRRRELLIGLSDHTIHCYNIDTCQLIAKLPAFHQSPPCVIAVHPTKNLAISTSISEAVLWDTNEWERKRLLEGMGSEGVQQAAFSPDGMMLCASFQDGSIFFWTVETLSLLWKITLAHLASPSSEMSSTMMADLRTPRISYFDISFNGEYFVYGGLSSYVYIWNLFEKRLIHEVSIPSFESKHIVQIMFLGNSNVLALLSSYGEIIFINVSTGTFVSQLKAKYSIQSLSISPDGRCLCAITKEQKYLLNLLRLDQILDPTPVEAPHVETFEGTKEEKHQKEIFYPEVQKSVAAPPKTFFELLESRQEATFFNRSKIRGFLHHYGSYPEQFRPLIWRYLLQLPENRAGYEALLDQGTHPSFRDFRTKYPLKSDRAARSMERILSCLGYWSPIFEDLEYLPSLVYPFVKLFWNDVFSCLETVMTVLINWCQKWWEYYPNPPVELLEMLAQLLSFHDSELYAHFSKHKATSEVYGWTLMQSLFSELFSKKDWLMVWDHLVSNSPSFIYHFIVAYLIHFRKPLMQVTDLKDFYYFFQRRNATNVTNIILKAYDLKAKTPGSLDPASFLKPFTACSRGEYPIFNQYPLFIVNYQTRMKNKIREEEQDYIKKRQLAAELSRLTDELRKEKQQWESSDWKMNDMIEKWWTQMMENEENQNQIKNRMNYYEKEKRLGAMAQIAEARKTFTQHHSKSTEDHLNQIARMVGYQKKSKKESNFEKQMEEDLKILENEWEQRRKEMIDTRQKIAKVRDFRVERMVQVVDKASNQGDVSVNSEHISQITPVDGLSIEKNSPTRSVTFDL